MRLEDPSGLDSVQSDEVWARQAVMQVIFLGRLTSCWSWACVFLGFFLGRLEFVSNDRQAGSYFNAKIPGYLSKDIIWWVSWMSPLSLNLLWITYMEIRKSWQSRVPLQLYHCLDLNRGNTGREEGSIEWCPIRTEIRIHLLSWLKSSRVFLWKWMFAICQKRSGSGGFCLENISIWRWLSFLVIQNAVDKVAENRQPKISIDSIKRFLETQATPKWIHICGFCLHAAIKTP